MKQETIGIILNWDLTQRIPLPALHPQNIARQL